MNEIKQTVINDNGNVAINYDIVEIDDDGLELSRNNKTIKVSKGDDVSTLPSTVQSICKVAWGYKSPPKQKAIIKEVEEEESRTEIVLEDGKYIQKTFTETVTKQVEELQWEEVPLYDEDGIQIQRLVSESVEAQPSVKYKKGDEIPEGKKIGMVKIPAIKGKDAVYENVMHKIPIME